MTIRTPASSSRRRKSAPGLSVRDDEIDGRQVADSHRRVAAELRLIGDDPDLVRLLHRRAAEFGLEQMEVDEVAARGDSRHRDHRIANLELPDEGDRRRAEGGGVVAAQFAAGHEDPIAVARGESPGDLDGVRHDDQVRANGERLGDVGARRAVVEDQAVAVAHHVAHKIGDDALGAAIELQAALKRRFVLAVGDHDAAVKTQNHAALDQRLDVAADRFGRNRQAAGEIGDAATAGLAHRVEDVGLGLQRHRSSPHGRDRARADGRTPRQATQPAA